MLVPRRNRIEAGALLSIDIDRFKVVNDSIGPKLGDRLLIEAAMRIAMAARESDTVARLGSDEFAVMLPDLSDYAEAERMARTHPERALRNRFGIDGHEIVVTASVGIALYPQDGTDAGSVMQRSNTAMARSKELGGNVIVFYEVDMNVRAEKRLLLETELRRAVRERQLVLHYQPIVDLRSMQVVGAEALMRWKHPERGLVAAGRVHPDRGRHRPHRRNGVLARRGSGRADATLERPGVVAAARVDQRQRSTAETRERHSRPDRARARRSCAPHVGRDHRKRVDGRSRRRARVSERNCAVSACGWRSTISGPASRRSAICGVSGSTCSKVDRSFISDLERSNTDLGLVASIVSMGRILGVDVVSEGVETDAQLRCLQQAGCNLIQGYLFSKPLPAAEFAAFARDFGKTKRRHRR